MTTDTEALQARLAIVQAENRRLRKMVGIADAGRIQRAKSAAFAILICHCAGFRTSRAEVCAAFRGKVSARQWRHGLSLLQWAGLADSAGNVTSRTRSRLHCSRRVTAVVKMLLVTGRYRAFLAGHTCTTHIVRLHDAGDVLAEIVTSH